MAGIWNPNANGTLGLEWEPTIGAQIQVTNTPAGFLRFRSTNAKVIGSLQPYLISNPSVTDPLVTIFDIYGAGNEPVVTGSTIATYSPSQDVAIGDWVTFSGGTTNLFTFIDDAVVYPPADVTDEIHVASSHTSDVSTPYTCRVASSGFPSNARVTRVSIIAVDGTRGPTPGTTTIGYRIERTTGEVYVPPASTFTCTTAGAYREVDCGEINPFTRNPWTPADIQAFSSGTWFIRVSAGNSNLGNTRSTVFSMALKVHYVPVENRVAAAMWERPAGAVSSTRQTDRLITLPGGATNWSKPASGDFTVVWRRARDLLITGSQTVATDVAWETQVEQLDFHQKAPPPPGMAGGQVAITTTGLITAPTLPTTANVPTLSLVVTGGAIDDDSQPYALVGTNLNATSTNTVAQRLTPGANKTYLGLRFLVDTPSPNVTGGPSLSVTVNRVSDNAQIGGIFTTTVANAVLGRAAGNGIYEVTGFLDAGAALTSGTQYEIRFLGSDSNAWTIVSPWALNAASASFAGTTDTARTTASGVLTDRDLAAVLFEQPAAPTGLISRVLTQAQDPACCFCAVNSIDQVLIQWNKTSLGGLFARYEVQRLNECGDWEPLYRLLTEAGAGNSPTIVSAVDYEAPRNTPVKYRVRVVGTDGSFSAWAETPFVTPLSYGAEVIFTSNANPSLQVAYDRVPSEDFGFIDHAADEIVPIYGTNYQVAFMEPEDRGVARSITVIANAVTRPVDANLLPIGGVDVFTPLRRISRAQIPYVCVLDYQANRTFAHVTLSNGNHKEPRNMYMLDAAYVPVTGTPVEVTIP